MAKLPYMPFYVADWSRDTKGLPDFCCGIWINAIVYLWDVPSRGRDTLPMTTWAAKCGTTDTNMQLALDTFKLHRTCNIVRHSDGRVTLVCRRMVREEKERQNNKKRQAKYRDVHARNAPITKVSRPHNKESHISESESESEKKKNKTPLPPEGDTMEVFNAFWEEYPKKNGKRIGKAKCVRLFRRLVLSDQGLCVQAAKHYAQSERVAGGFTKDPERFLKAEFWREWIEPETPALSNGHAPSPRVCTWDVLGDDNRKRRCGAVTTGKYCPEHETAAQVQRERLAALRAGSG